MSVQPVLQLDRVSKSFGPVKVIDSVSIDVHAGHVQALLGENGAGKSTLIKILAGLHPPTSGDMLIDDVPVTFTAPADALAAGIATVYQDLAVVGQMSVWRNFFLGQELVHGFLETLRIDEMRKITLQQLADMGVELPNVDIPISHLSGGQRQVVAIARAIYFGARVVILDEPTAALGVKQSGMVLRYVNAARKRGIAVVLITHNPHHAHLVGDYFTVLNMGQQVLNAKWTDVSVDDLALQMAGGGELSALEHELQR